jgi:3-phenylpropionate/trans-cinnamate dioxygenase ferredoxin subunit
VPSYVVCNAADLQPGSRATVDADGRSIVVFNVDGRLYALRNTCPHQGAELACGTLGGTMIPSRPYEYVFGLEDRVLRCPWHGWEFDITDGQSLFAPGRVRVKTYAVRLDDDKVVVEA